MTGDGCRKDRGWKDRETERMFTGVAFGAYCIAKGTNISAWCVNLIRTFAAPQ